MQCETFMPCARCTHTHCFRTNAIFSVRALEHPAAHCVHQTTQTTDRNAKVCKYFLNYLAIRFLRFWQTRFINIYSFSILAINILTTTTATMAGTNEWTTHGRHSYRFHINVMNLKYIWTQLLVMSSAFSLFLFYLSLPLSPVRSLVCFFRLPWC